MSGPYCAICGNHVAPDGDHVQVDAEHKLIADRNSTEDYLFHGDCWSRLSSGWVKPA